MLPDVIEKKTLQIHHDPDEPTTFTSLQDLADALPDNTPRFVLLSYPLQMPDGRTKVPYVLLNYMPTTCNAEARMLYAGAKELMRAESEAGRALDVTDEEDVLDVAEQLKGE